MDIMYIGHSCFKLKGKSGIVVTDPFDTSVGLPLPKISADIVTVSHHHPDHDNVTSVSGTARRELPFLVDAPGEYELFDISVFGFPSFHDNEKGKVRGKNMISLIHIDGVNIVHLGDVGHELSDREIEKLGDVDVLLIPVGGHFTIDEKQASKMIGAIEPSLVIPMHYKTDKHSSAFSEIAGLDAFLKEMGKEGVEAKDKLTVTAGSLPEEMEVVVLKAL